MRKIYLSKWQAKSVLSKIESSDNWVKGEIDEELQKKIKFYTRENIYNKIPYIKNKYWIFTNRSNAVEDKHSVDECLNVGYYSAVIGIFDLDNNILYYYSYSDN